MIGSVTVGTNDIQRSAKFYDQLLAVIGAERLTETQTYIMWGTSATSPVFSVIKPYDGKPATVGNGVMVAFLVDSAAKVDALHRKALSLGGRDEGAPGQRGEGFYAAYFRDVDGNKLNAYFTG